MVQKGKIGKITNLRIEMPSDGYARIDRIGPPQHWRQQETAIPMIFLDLGTHLYHLVRLLIGKSSGNVNSIGHVLSNKLNLLDNVEIWEERHDKINISYWFSKAHLGVKNGLKIAVYGSKGSLTWFQHDPDFIKFSDKDSNITIINRGNVSRQISKLNRFKAGHPTGFIEAFANFYSDLAEDFVSFKKGKQQSRWISNITEAIDGIDFLNAAAESMKKRRWISYG